MFLLEFKTSGRLWCLGSCLCRCGVVCVCGVLVVPCCLGSSDALFAVT